jgi:ribosomal protein S26
MTSRLRKNSGRGRKPRGATVEFCDSCGQALNPKEVSARRREADRSNARRFGMHA